MAPHGPRPGGVADGAADDMDVQLAHDIAERADIDLVDARWLRTKRDAAAISSISAARASGVEIDDLDEIRSAAGRGSARDSGVVHQQQARQREIADRKVSAARRGSSSKVMRASHAVRSRREGRAWAMVSAMSASVARAADRPGGRAAAESEDRHMLAGVVVAAEGRIVAVIGGDDAEIVGAHRRFDLRSRASKASRQAA